MAVASEQKRCACCRAYVFPKLGTTEPSERSPGCGHERVFWYWVCDCGWLERWPVKRCPFCVGLRPPEDDP